MGRSKYLLCVVLALCLFFRPPEVNSQSEYYLDVNVSRSYRVFAVEEDVSDREVLGTRTWWISLRNYEMSTLVGPELEIRMIHKPDLIRFYPSPTRTTQDGEYYVLRWKFDQTPPKGQNGVSVFFSEYEVFRLGANMTRVVSPTVITSQGARLTCEMRVVSSSDLEGVSVDMRFPETDEVAPVLKAVQPTPSLEEPNRRSWWASNVRRRIPYTFKIELDVLNKVFPSSVMYKPYVFMKPVDKNPRRGRTYSNQGVSVQDGILGTVTWRVDGVHYWAWRHEEAREIIFESVSSWPAGELSRNMLQADRSGLCFWSESVLGASQTPARHMVDKPSQAEDRMPLRSFGDEWFSVPCECLWKSSTVLSQRLSSVFFSKPSLQLAKSDVYNPREDIES